MTSATGSTSTTASSYASMLPAMSLPKLSDLTSYFTYDHRPADQSQTATSPPPSPTRLQPSLAAIPESSPKTDRPASLRPVEGGSSFKRHRKNTSVTSIMSDSFNNPTREGSFTSESSSKARKSKKSKTSYSICHAPPRSGVKSKIQVRAKPVLQYQRIESRSRPTPAFELLPSAICSPKLSVAIAKVFGAKHGLCPNDLALVKAEQYHLHEERDEDESRDVLALICAGRKGEARDSTNASPIKITFADGSEWQGHQMRNGSYECTSVDSHGLKNTVRWVQKKPKEGESAEAEKKFNFSTINPNSRRHPIIASLTSASLDISNAYTMPPLSATPIPSPANTPLMSRTSSEDAITPSEAITTTDDLRNIITATSVWVAVTEGWCPSFRYDSSTCGLARSPSGMSRRTTSPSKNQSTEDLDSVKRNSSFRQNTLRAASIFRRGQQSEAKTRPEVAAASIQADEPAFHRRARSDTTSTVIMHRPIASTSNLSWRSDASGRPRAGTAASMTSSTHIPTLDPEPEVMEPDSDEEDCSSDEDEHDEKTDNSELSDVTVASGEKEGAVSSPPTSPEDSQIGALLPKNHAYDEKAASKTEAQEKEVVQSPFADNAAAPASSKRSSRQKKMDVITTEKGHGQGQEKKKSKWARIFLCGMV